MKKKTQLYILILLIIISISIPVTDWILKTNEKSDVDELIFLLDNIDVKFSPNQKLSFTTLSKGVQEAVLFDYALIALAPIVVTDNQFKNDTIIAVDRVHNTSLNMYNKYNVIAKKRGEKLFVNILVKPKQ